VAQGVTIFFDAVNRAGGPIRKVIGDVGRASDAFDRCTAATKKLADAQEKLDARMARAAKFGLVADQAGRMARAMRGAVGDTVQAARGVSAAQAELATLGFQNLEMIAERGRAMQGRYAGVMAEDYIRATYDVRSGISSLSEEAVADFTDMAVMTAKATKASAEQMTGLFATGFGIFKQLDAEMSDSQWGKKFGNSLAASVQLFKTDGAKMQQAIESAGSEAALLGVGLSENFAVLGMLQQKMQAGVAGTSWRAFTENASRAQEAFAEMGMDVQVLNDAGGLNDMSAILADLQQAFGDEYNANVGAAIKEAFGTAEAAKVITGLWGQQDALAANVQQLEKAGTASSGFAANMAELGNAGLDARLSLFAQQWNSLQQQMGNAFAPMLGKILAPLSALMEKFSAWMEKHKTLAGILGGAVLAVTAFATGLAGLFSLLSGGIATVAMFRFASTHLGVSIHKHAVVAMRSWGASIVSCSKKMVLFAAQAVKKAAAAAWSFAVQTVPKVIASVASMGAGFIAAAATAIPAFVAGLGTMAAAGWAAMVPFLPIIGIVAAVAGAALLIVKFWKPIKGFFAGLFEPGKNMLAGFFGLVKTVFSFSPLGLVMKAWGPVIDFFGGIGQKLSAIGQFLGFGKKAVAGAVVGAAVSASPAVALPGSEPSALVQPAAQPSAPSVQIAVYAAPGMDESALARKVGEEVAAALEAEKRKAQSNRNGRLYD
jgi:TP901 family phage tail tape measure protein